MEGTNQCAVAAVSQRGDDESGQRRGEGGEGEGEGEGGGRGGEEEAGAGAGREGGGCNLQVLAINSTTDAILHM